MSADTARARADTVRDHDQGPIAPDGRRGL